MAVSRRRSRSNGPRQEDPVRHDAERLAVVQPVMAELFGVSANMIVTAERQVKLLLERARGTGGAAHHQVHLHCHIFTV